MTDRTGLNLQLDSYESRALGLLAVKHGPASTKSELLRAMIRAAVMSDPDVRTWLEAFPENASERASWSKTSRSS